MQIDTGVLFPLVSVLIGVAGFIGGKLSNAKKTGQEDGEMRSDIKHIKNTVEKQDAKLSTVVENYEDVKLEIVRLKGRLEKLEQKVDFLHGEGGQV